MHLIRYMILWLTLFNPIILYSHEHPQPNPEPMPSHEQMPSFNKGQYIGYATAANLDYKIPMILDLFILQEDREYQKLGAVVKFLTNGFNSHEYIGFFYDKVDYSWHSNRLLFNNLAHDITIDNLIIEEDVANGIIISSTSVNRLEFRLVHESIASSKALASLFSDKYILPLLEGQYEQIGKKNQTLLQLETGNWQFSSGMSRNLFDGYLITGRIAYLSENLCAVGKHYCVLNNITQISFNFFDNILQFTARPRSFQCRWFNQDLVCGEHSYRKKQELFPSVDSKSVVNSEDHHDHNHDNFTALSDPNLIEGEYSGNVSFPTGRQSALWLRVITSKYEMMSHMPEVMRVEVDGKLFFDTQLNQDFISLNFAKRVFLETFPYFALFSQNGYFLLVKNWLENTMEGTLYHKSFGRVGHFQLNKTHHTPPIQSSSHLSGKYSSNGWLLSLQYLGDRDASSMATLPALLRGNLQLLGLSGRRSITETSFDFFTDRIAFKLDDDRQLIGIKQDSQISVFIPPIVRWGAVLKAPLTVQYFKKL